MTTLHLLIQFFPHSAALVSLYFTCFLDFRNDDVARIECQRSVGYLQGASGLLSLSCTGVAPLDIMVSNITISFWPVARGTLASTRGIYDRFQRAIGELMDSDFAGSYHSREQAGKNLPVSKHFALLYQALLHVITVFDAIHNRLTYDAMQCHQHDSHRPAVSIGLIRGRTTSNLGHQIYP